MTEYRPSIGVGASIEQTQIRVVVVVFVGLSRSSCRLLPFVLSERGFVRTTSHAHAYVHEYLFMATSDHDDDDNDDLREPHARR